MHQSNTWDADLQAWPAGQAYTFTHAGYTCVLRRCPEALTWYGQIRDVSISVLKSIDGTTCLRVHGGLSFVDFASGTLQFDCNHFMSLDMSPVFGFQPECPHATYKTYEFVRKNVENLARQVRACVQAQCREIVR